MMNRDRKRPNLWGSFGWHHVTGGGLWLVVISAKKRGFVKVIGAGLGGMQTMLSLIQGGRKVWWLVVGWDVWKGFWKMEELESRRFFSDFGCSPSEESSNLPQKQLSHKTWSFFLRTCIKTVINVCVFPMCFQSWTGCTYVYYAHHVGLSRLTPNGQIHSNSILVTWIWSNHSVEYSAYSLG